MARLGHVGSLKIEMKVKLELSENWNYLKMKIWFEKNFLN